MPKMVDISVEKYTDAKVCTITVDNKELFWVRMHDVQEGLGVKNMSDLVRKKIHGIFETKYHTKDQIRKYKRCEKDLDNNSNATFVYVRSDLMSRIIKNCRGEKRRGENKIGDLRRKLGFRLNDITMSKEESVTTEIIKTFSNEKILPQHFALSYQIDLYFPKHKLAIEVDEKGHTDRDERKKTKQKKKLKKKELGCKFIRINPDAKNYDIFVEIGKMQNYIIESTKKLTEKSTKKSLIDSLSKILQELEFKSNHSIKSNCLKWIFKKILPDYKK